MPGVGRNDACPCGSGRKFKRCCGAPGTVPRAAGYGKADCERAFEALLRYGQREESAQHLERAQELYWDGRQPEVWKRAGEEAGVQRLGCFAHYLLIDRVLEDGSSIAERFLKRRGSRDLSEAEQRYLRDLARTHLGLYEVQEAKPGEGLRLLDLTDGGESWVVERSASRELVRWDLLGARMMQRPDGHWEMEAELYPVPVEFKGELVRRSVKLRRLLQDLPPHLGRPAWRLELGPLMNRAWMAAYLRPVPRIVTTEGDDLVITTLVFELDDHAETERVLESCAELERGEEDSPAWSWVEPHEDWTRALGTVRIEGGRLVLETTSRSRAQRGRALLESLLGERLRFVGEKMEDPRYRLEHPRPAEERKDAAAAGIDPTTAAELELQFLDRHYRTWPDEPVPALGGRTPRDAARSPRMRKRVVDLVKLLENQEARRASRGEKPYEFSWMWADLGLEQPSS